MLARLAVSRHLTAAYQLSSTFAISQPASPGCACEGAATPTQRTARLCRENEPADATAAMVRRATTGLTMLLSSGLAGAAGAVEGLAALAASGEPFLAAAHEEQLLPLAIDHFTHTDGGGLVTGATVRLVWALLNDRVEQRRGALEETEPEFITHTIVDDPTHVRLKSPLTFEASYPVRWLSPWDPIHALRSREGVPGISVSNLHSKAILSGCQRTSI